ncbi:MAG: hypothetical protein KDA45_08140 [Planctomycetales bacterium]|nr:hypothetical protein [Planctomycetales bacterium]
MVGLCSKLTLVCWGAGMLLTATLCRCHAEELPPPATTSEPEFTALLRIPSALLIESVNRRFHHRKPVDRVILGTHSRGTADCVGQVHCTLAENRQGAEFNCHVVGTITSQTRGTQGPAIIHSQAHTAYRAHKTIFFDGRQFQSRPATVCANTALTISEVDSTAPGLRGRLVRRVASRRAADLRGEAEAITAGLARQELQVAIDAEFDTRLAAINQALNLRLSLLPHLSDWGQPLAVRSYTHCLEICLASDRLANRQLLPPPPEPESQAAADQAVELWLHAEQGRGEPSLLATWLRWSRPWLDLYTANRGLLSELTDEKIRIERQQNWLVLRLLP